MAMYGHSRATIPGLHIQAYPLHNHRVVIGIVGSVSQHRALRRGILIGGRLFGSCIGEPPFHTTLNRQTYVCTALLAEVGGSESLIQVGCRCW